MSFTENEIINDIAEFLKLQSSDLNTDSEIGKVENWDSIGHLNLMMGLSQKYNFEVNAGVLAETQRISDIIALINK